MDMNNIMICIALVALVALVLGIVALIKAGKSGPDGKTGTDGTTGKTAATTAVNKQLKDYVAGQLKDYVTKQDLELKDYITNDSDISISNNWYGASNDRKYLAGGTVAGITQTGADGASYPGVSWYPGLSGTNANRTWSTTLNIQKV
jgi:hypothetical protein